MKLYINGNEAEYTGETMELHGGLFYEIRMLEGADAGKVKVTLRAPGEVAAGVLASPATFKGRVPQASW